MGQSASNDSSGNRPTTASTSAQLPGEDKNEIVVQLYRNTLRLLDGYYEIDLKYVVEAQNPVKAGRLIRILDGSGQPFVLNLVSKRIMEVKCFVDNCNFRRKISYQLVDRCISL